MSNTRLFECENGKVYEFPDKHCVFCKHCDNFLFDSSGPYCFLCELMKGYDGGCDGFEDDGYEFDEKDYLDRMAAASTYRQMLRKKLETKPEFRKAYEEEMDRVFNKILFGEGGGE